MAYGIFDYDEVFRVKYMDINLEAMKLSNYYKQKNRIIYHLENPDKFNIYEKVFFRKDSTKTKLPREYNNIEGIEYGGLYFFGGKYLRLPDDIENSFPDYTYYEKFYAKRGHELGSRANSRFIRDIKSSLLRLSVDNVNCDISKRKFLKDRASDILIFDKEIQDLNGAYDTLFELQKKYTLLNRYHISIRQFEDFRKWADLNWAVTRCKYKIVGKISNEEYMELIAILKEKKYQKTRIIFGPDHPNPTDAEHLWWIKQTLDRQLYGKFFRTEIFFFRNLIWTDKRNLWGDMYQALEGFSTFNKSDNFDAYLHKHGGERIRAFMQELIKVDNDFEKMLYTKPIDLREENKKWTLIT